MVPCSVHWVCSSDWSFFPWSARCILISSPPSAMPTSFALESAMVSAEVNQSQRAAVCKSSGTLRRCFAIPSTSTMLAPCAPCKIDAAEVWTNPSSGGKSFEAKSLDMPPATRGGTMPIPVLGKSLCRFGPRWILCRCCWKRGAVTTRRCPTVIYFLHIPNHDCTRSLEVAGTPIYHSFCCCHLSSPTCSTVFLLCVSVFLAAVLWHFPGPRWCLHSHLGNWPAFLCPKDVFFFFFFTVCKRPVTPALKRWTVQHSEHFHLTIILSKLFEGKHCCSK